MATQVYKPQPTPETAHFWEGTRVSELRLQRCGDCAKTYFPPRPFCPVCHSDNISIVKASGRATLFSYVISHRRTPGQQPPFSIAVVELEEGPRLMTNIVGCAQTPEVLKLDMPVTVDFRALDDEISLAVFRPASEGAE